jgi:fructose transport system ATP-binding protein
MRSVAQRINIKRLVRDLRSSIARWRVAPLSLASVIVDEPTAALGLKETHMVLDLTRRVRERGLPVILISQCAPNVFEVADRVHIQRLGRRSAVAIIIGAMAGEKVAKN